MMSIIKRAYFVSIVDDVYGIGVIAVTARAAKVTGHSWLEDHLTEHIDWIDIKAKWHRDISVDDFKSHKDQVFKKWNERSKHPWRTDLSLMADLKSDRL